MKTPCREGKRQKVKGKRGNRLLPLTAFLSLFAFCLLPFAFAQSPGDEVRTAQARQQETGFGNAVADGIRKATRADAAWIAGGEFRDTTFRPAAAGAEALSLLDDPNDPLVILQLSGQTIREALELGLQQYPKPGKAFLHVSGLRVAFGGRAPAGRRVLSVTIEGQPIAEGRTYRVAMTRTLAVGSFGFFRLWPEAKNARPENVTIGEALRQGLVNSPLRISGDGRMVEKEQ